jgi:phage shock protein A
MSELSREQRLQRLEEAETAVRRVLQTLEREIHLARNGGEDADLRDSVSTAEQEMQRALDELRGSRTGG